LLLLLSSLRLLFFFLGLGFLFLGLLLPCRFVIPFGFLGYRLAAASPTAIVLSAIPPSRGRGGDVQGHYH
jgi:hypothetical protein